MAIGMVYYSLEGLVAMFPVFQIETHHTDGRYFLSFVDKNISDEDLIVESEIGNNNYVEYTLFSDSIYIRINITSNDYDQYPLTKALMTMNYDFGLSDTSCAALYECGFEICYRINKNARMQTVKYDRNVIMRRHTISEIIKS